MAYPPAALPTNRTNATPQQNTHPGDHNALALAINDTVVELGANPSGVDATIEARLARIEAETTIRGIRWYNTGQSCPATTATVLNIGSVVWDVPGTPPFAEANGGMRIQGAGVYAVHAGIAFTTMPTATSEVSIISDAQGVLAMSYIPIPNVETRLGVSAVMSLSDQDRLTIKLYLAGTAASFVSANVCVARIFKM